MARRLEIELTSNRSDGKWTWRAAGAKQPKGILDGALLPEGTGVGDVVKVEADATLDGLEITTVLPARAPRSQARTLPLLGSGRDQPLVTSQLAPKARSRARGTDNRDTGSTERKRPGRKSRRGRDTDRTEGTKGSTAKRSSGRVDRDTSADGQQRADRRGRSRDARRSDANHGTPRDERPRKRNARTPQERPRPRSAPKVPRLRPGNKNRRAALAALPEIQQSLAEEVLKGGVPGVRKSIERMNKMAEIDGIPKVRSEPLVALAEKMSPVLKSAEWRDRAEAAIAGIETVDLRDIRSVVVAADSGARDEESRELAAELREGLSTRVDREHRLWLNEIAQHLAEGRIVRALRLSGHPPKAGSPLPFDMAERLTRAASESLNSDATSRRWATVLDAVAFSPVRSQVTPEGQPARIDDELLAAVRKLASKVPGIAATFGVAASGPRKRPETDRRIALPPPPPEPAPIEADK